MRPDVLTPTAAPKTGARGQVVLMFAFALVAILAMAALLIDGGLAWSNRRAAQSAADVAALAAALANQNGGDITLAAWALANQNGFDGNLVDCDGASHIGEGVVVNSPPLSGPHTAALEGAEANSYVEVIVTRAMQTTFARAIGLPCFLVSARAVASFPTAAVAGCSMCSLNSSSKNHTLVLKNGATLRVDGDIYINSSNGGYTPGTCALDKWKVCGDGFDIFGAGGLITARTISVNGGWETHDLNDVQADYLPTGCVESPDAPSQTAYLPSRVCIHQPQIADPLNDPLKLGNAVSAPVAGAPPVAGGSGHCGFAPSVPTGTAVSPSPFVISSGSWTIFPGTYYGGVRILGNASVCMATGIYYMSGGGFSVTGSASLDGTEGVMIYNAIGTAVNGANSTPATIDTVPAKVKGQHDPKLSKGLTSDKNPSDPGDTVTYTMTLDRDKAATTAVTGTISFYDGSSGNPSTPTLIAGCQDLPLVSAGGNLVMASCSKLYNSSGTRAILAIYLPTGTYYNAIGDTLTQTITNFSAIGPVTLSTGGNIQIKGAPSPGQYAGLVIFQDRASNLTITVQPGSGLGACGGNWVTQDVPHVPGGSPPNACGALGGIQGTIYAAHADALVFVTASGVANLQIISGKIQIDSNADARFAYTPELFANGVIRLVE